MSIRRQDIMYYAGGECLRKFGVPVWGVTSRQRVAPAFARTGAVGPFTGRDGILRQASADRLRVEWLDLDGDGDRETPSFLLEVARTNPVLWNRDLTNAAWTKTNCAAVKDQTGIDGVASSASKITASAGNATCLQAITLASSGRFQSCYVKRITGTGTINMTMDNGSTWIAIAVTSSWARVTIPTQTIANPTVGFRIVTNGDAIAVDYVQNENGRCATSPIATTTLEVTRNADGFATPFPYRPQAMAGLFDFTELAAGTSLVPSGYSLDHRLFQIGNVGNTGARLFLVKLSSSANYGLWLFNAAGTNQLAWVSGVSLGQVYGDRVQIHWTIGDDGAMTMQARKDSGSGFGAWTVGTPSAALALESAWGDQLASLSHPAIPDSSRLFSGKVVRGSHWSADEMLAVFA